MQNVQNIVAIGDIHGCAELLQSLITKIEAQWNWDRIVFIGDYIDRGEDSYGVVEQIVALQEKYPGKITCLKGNHEQWMLQTLENPRSISWILGMNGFSTMESYSRDFTKEFRGAMQKVGKKLLTEKDKDWQLPYQEFFYKIMPCKHLEFFLSLKNYHTEPQLIFAHAGIAPGIPMHLQSEDDLLWIESEFYDNYNGKESVIVGHKCTTELREDANPLPYITKNNIIAIDTGSSKTGVITAYLWPHGKILSSV